jgi:matrixin
MRGVVRRWRAALPFVLLALASVGTGAYALIGPRWVTRPVPFYINPVNNDLSEADATSAIQSAAANWTAQTNADFSFYYMGRTSGSSVGNNGRNEVFFRNDSNGNVIAATYLWFDSRNRMTDADTLIYDGGFRFFGAGGCSGGMYLEDVMTHEFGHALGLDHSSVATATMYPSISFCSSGARTLDPDDIAGVEALYPPIGVKPNTAPAVTISSPAGNISVTQGTVVNFVGSAFDQQDGDLSASIMWSSSLTGAIGTGPVASAALTVGTHVVTATVPDSGGLSGSAQVTVTVTAASPPPLSPSPDGTRLPPSTEIVDSARNVWTLSGVVILRNGVQAGNGLGTQLTWCGGVIRAFGTDSQWWAWTGAGWNALGTIDPCNGTSSSTSPDGTRLPPATGIVDTGLNVWTLSGVMILRNGVQAGNGLGTQLTWCGGVIRAFGTDAQWWVWTGAGWNALGTIDPCTGGSPSPDGTRVPPAAQIVDNELAAWTLAGTTVLRNGQQTDGLATVLTWCGGMVRAFGLDSQWWAWTGAGWVPLGQADGCTGT